VVEDADDFDVEALGLGPLEDGQAVALHAVLDLRNRYRERPSIASCQRRGCCEGEHRTHRRGREQRRWTARER
jgi:hypothetical protein